MKHEVAFPVCRCGKCRRPMKLVNTVPKLVGLSELLIFRCSACDEIDTRGGPETDFRYGGERCGPTRPRATTASE